MQAALVGLQHPHAMSHLATLQQLPEVESIVVCGESRADLERAKAGQGAKVTAWHTDLGELLNGVVPSSPLFAFATTADPPVSTGSSKPAST